MNGSFQMLNELCHCSSPYHRPPKWHKRNVRELLSCNVKFTKPYGSTELRCRHCRKGCRPIPEDDPILGDARYPGGGEENS